MGPKVPARDRYLLVTSYLLVVGYKGNAEGVFPLPSPVPSRNSGALCHALAPFRLRNGRFHHWPGRFFYPLCDQLRPVTAVIKRPDQGTGKRCRTA